MNGPGAHRPLVQRQAGLGHAGLRVEGVGLPGQRRGERHRHPVAPLRVLALQANAKRVAVDRLRARQRPAPKVEERLVLQILGQAGEQLGVLALDQLAILLQADHVLGEHRIHRRLDARGGVALERVDEVLGHQLARALLELPRRTAAAEFGPRQRMVGVVAMAALRVLGERRVRLVHHAALDRDVVHALGDALGRRIVGQALPVGIEEHRRHHLRGHLGDQLVRALQVVVAVGRLVDLVGVGRLRIRVRRRRIEVARRALVERVDERVAAHQLGRVRVVAAGRRHPARAPAAAPQPRRRIVTTPPARRDPAPRARRAGRAEN